MKKFSLRELRNDVIDHVDLPESLLNNSSFWSTVWIDWMLIQMIGIYAYELMSDRHSNYKYYVSNSIWSWVSDQDTGHTIWLG